MIIIRNTNSTMMLTKREVIISTVVTMRIMPPKEAKVKKEDITNLDTKGINSVKKVTLLKDIMTMIIRDIKGITDSKGNIELLNYHYFIITI